jgi:hypothetical protein
MEPERFNTLVTVVVGITCVPVSAGVETDNAGAGVNAGGGMAVGALVAGAFVAATLISPGPGRLVVVSVCAGRRFADKKKHQRTIMADRHNLPPHIDVKKAIS